MARDAVSEVRERTDIVELVGQYVPLKRTGRNFKGLCPFHQEKTPSFIVFPESGNFHCFGCGKGGDAFTFYQLIERLDFREALRDLAKRAGVALVDAAPVAPEVDAHRAKLIELNELAATFYANILVNAAAGEPGRRVAAERGLDAAMIERFRLGYALDAWDALLRFLSSRGVDPALAVEAGLLQARDTGGHYDRFRGRLMFPIRDRDGRVVGFGGRIVGEGQPKYLNSPQSAIFDKSALLYGLDVAKEEIRRRDQVVIVEGYIDAIAAHQFGHGNVVAAMGTALTEPQVGQVKRLAKQIVLALDADAAGQLATLRSIEKVRDALAAEPQVVSNAGGLVHLERKLSGEIRIVQLPEGKDPDELIRRAPEKWPEVVAAARPFLEFLVDAVTSRVPPDDVRAKAAAVAQIAPLLRAAGDPVVVAHHVQRLSNRLRVPEWAVLAEINKRDLTRRGKREEEAQPVRPPRASPEDHLLALVLRHRALLGPVLAQIRDEEILDARNRALLAALRNPELEALEPDQIIAGLDDALADHAERLLDDLARSPTRLTGQILREASQALALLRRERLDFLKRQLHEAISAAEQTNEADDRSEFLARLNELLARERALYPPPSPYFKDARDARG